MKKRLAMTLVLGSVAAVGIAQITATTKPNFAGTWKLNLQKSDLGPMASNGETDTIVQTNDEVKVAITSDSQMGSMKYTFSAKLDGTDTPVPADAFPAESPFRLISSKAEWQGNSLVITQTLSAQDTKGTMASTYTLSDDGKVLTKATHIKVEMGEFDSKSVYEKI